MADMQPLTTRDLNKMCKSVKSVQLQQEADKVVANQIKQIMKVAVLLARYRKYNNRT